MKCENAVICPLLELQFSKIWNFENLKIVKNRPKSRPALGGIFGNIAQNAKNSLGNFFQLFKIRLFWPKIKAKNAIFSIFMMKTLKNWHFYKISLKTAKIGYFWLFSEFSQFSENFQNFVTTFQNSEINKHRWKSI